MKLSKLSYSFSQAKKNMIRNGLMSIASLFTISSCLIILGVFTVVTLNFNYITEQVKDQCEIEVFISLDAKEDRITEIGQEILAMSNVKSIEYISKEGTHCRMHGIHILKVMRNCWTQRRAMIYCRVL